MIIVLVGACHGVYLICETITCTYKINFTCCNLSGTDYNNVSFDKSRTLSFERLEPIILFPISYLCGVSRRRNEDRTYVGHCSQGIPYTP